MSQAPAQETEETPIAEPLPIAAQILTADVEIGDDDSAIGDELDINSISSIASSIYKFRVENGRTYNAYGDRSTNPQQNKTIISWACLYYSGRRIFISDQGLWNHALSLQELNIDTPCGSEYVAKPLNSPIPTGYISDLLSGLQKLNIDTPRGSEDVPKTDIPKGGQIPDNSQKGADARDGNIMDAQGSSVGRKPLGASKGALIAKSLVSSSHIASVQAQKSRAQILQPRARKPFHSPPQNLASESPSAQETQNTPAPSAIFSRTSLSQSQSQGLSKDETFDIILQTETRPISQEQLVAEVKGIYAGLVMVEAKCIEVDNKQAALAQADIRAPPKLNNEQWQTLIALHRTLLHEHQDFFLTSQHPSASLALKGLASKYAMPARMWQHGIHSFLELLRHRLPASMRTLN